MKIIRTVRKMIRKFRTLFNQILCTKKITQIQKHLVGLRVGSLFQSSCLLI